MKILLDAGHAKGYNPYVGVTGFYEGDQMYKYAFYLKAELEAYGCSVGLTKTSVTDDPSLLKRGEMAQGYDLMLSLHTNGGGGTYVVVYDAVDKPNTTLAQAIATAIARIKGVDGRVRYRYSTATGGGEGTTPQSSTKDDYYTVLYYASRTNCKSAMIIEHGFHDHSTWVSYLINDDNLKQMAKIEAQTIATYYKLSKTIGIVMIPNATVNLNGTGYKEANTYSSETSTSVTGYVWHQERIQVLQEGSSRFYIRYNLDAGGTKEAWINKAYVIKDSTNVSVDYKSLYEKAQAELTTKNATITDLTNQLNTKKNEVTTLNNTIADKDNKITSLNGEIAKLNGELSNIKSSVTEKENIIIAKNNNIIELENMNSTLVLEVETLKDSVSKKTNTIEQNIIVIQDLASKDEKNIENINKLTEEINKLQDENNKLVKEVENLTRENTNLKSTIDPTITPDYTIIELLSMILNKIMGRK